VFDNEVESLSLFDPLTDHILTRVPRYTVYPSSHYVTPRSTTHAIETMKVKLAERIAFCRAGTLLPRRGSRTLWVCPRGLRTHGIGFTKIIENHPGTNITHSVMH
jgi:excinuclease UvrABC helicase subunit UvrB